MLRLLPIVTAVLALLVAAAPAPAASARDTARRPARAADPAVPAVKARRAQSFADSVGVNTHVHYTDTAYRDMDRVVAALDDAGITTVRDGLAVTNRENHRRLRRLAEHGVRLNLIMGDPRGRWDTGPLDALFGVLRRELPTGVIAVEGANEYDASGDPDWAAQVRRHQQRLHALVQGDRATRAIEVLGPSFIRHDSLRAVGDLSAWTDRASMHPYPGGRPSGANLVKELAVARVVAGDAPVIATETGYHNALAGRTGHPGVSEAAAGAYVPRLALEHFRQGVPRSYLYELVDQRPEPAGRDPEQHFGLLRHDFSPKPAFTALKTLLGAVRDPGPAFAPGALRVAVDGGGPEVRRLLLQRRDGTFVLALWRETPVEPGQAATPLTVRFGEAVGPVRVRALDGSPARTAADPAGGVRVALGHAATLLEVRPARTTGARSAVRAKRARAVRARGRS